MPARTRKRDGPPQQPRPQRSHIKAHQQSGSISRAYSKAAEIGGPETPSTTAVDIKDDYEAKYGAVGAGNPKVFFKYFFVNTATGEKSGEMLAVAKFTASESNED